jgi:hypothetical protein
MIRPIARLALLGALLILIVSNWTLLAVQPTAAQEVMGLTPEPEPTRPPDPDPTSPADPTRAPAPDPGGGGDDDDDDGTSVQTGPPPEIQKVLPAEVQQQATPEPTPVPTVAPTEAAPADPAPTAAPAPTTEPAPRPGTLPITARDGSVVTEGPLVPLLLFLAVLALFVRELLPLLERRR